MADASELVPKSATNNVKWTSEVVNALITMRGRYNELFSGKRGTAKTGWLKVAAAMNLTPPEEYWKQVQKKWFNLAQKYKEIKTPPSGMGSEDGALDPVSWQYFLAMDGVLGDKHIINPPHLVDTSLNLPSTSTSTQSPPPHPSTPTCDMFQEIIFLDYVADPVPSASTAGACPKVSLADTLYLGSVRAGTKRGRPADNPQPPKKKEKEDPYLAFLREDHEAAAHERRQAVLRDERDAAEQREFRKAMLDIMGKFFDSTSKK